MSNLANTYSALGRHRDALVLFQETLEFRQRVLPKKHPQIGDCTSCVTFTSDDVLIFQALRWAMLRLHTAHLGGTKKLWF